MRQLLAEGWMHNRVRMVVASFLVKDLKVEWTHGARHFLRHLVDGDLASNQHNWQWVAGSGTDAAPYVRIFNPVTQGRRFDPDGTYLRRWVPELRELATEHVHEPWTAPGGPPGGYPGPIVDHGEERAAALADYERLRRQG
jgi:deoxyribodipyrimidine photo-lyase